MKDIIDVEGCPTTAGCRAVAKRAQPAPRDAACLAGARAAGAQIVGKTNLHELAFGPTGINPWFGTPRNPLDGRCIPGGSSSGSAVAVADGDADIAFGSDTGGSVRIPSACCGTAGLKTTWGRIPLDGVFLLSESLDTVGPMARDVRGVVEGMALLEPGFTAAATAPTTVGRVRLADVDSRIDDAIDRVLAEAEVNAVDIPLAGWADALQVRGSLQYFEAWRNDRRWLEEDRAGIGTDVAERLEIGASVPEPALVAARAAQARWKAEMARCFERVELLAAPTLAMFAPRIDDVAVHSRLVECTFPVNLAGLPSLAVPVPAAGSGLPGSIQLIGPASSEERLVAAGLIVEAAALSLG